MVKKLSQDASQTEINFPLVTPSHSGTETYSTETAHSGSG